MTRAHTYLLAINPRLFCRRSRFNAEGVRASEREKRDYVLPCHAAGA